MQAIPLYWPWWRKFLFRFFFIFLVLTIEPWTWFGFIPGISYLYEFYYKLIDWLVYFFNDHFFHIAKELVMMNGSGDTSYGWALEGFILVVATTGGLIWSALDRRRANYKKLSYWLCLFTRYYLALVALRYGMYKIFGLQMPFPTLSQMATPLGDFLPMRLSWLFIGYSKTYQFFAGMAECFVGILLLYRRTATLGVLLAVGVFLNVMMLNLSYDIPVKIYAMKLFLSACFYWYKSLTGYGAFLFRTNQRPFALYTITNIANPG